MAVHSNGRTARTTLTVRFAPTTAPVKALEQRLVGVMNAWTHLGLVADPTIDQVIVRDDLRVTRDTFVASFIDVACSGRVILEMLTLIPCVSSARYAPPRHY